jgi:xanthine dehydrogenase YagR molybdenum-binding subunit
VIGLDPEAITGTSADVGVGPLAPPFPRPRGGSLHTFASGCIVFASLLLPRAHAICYAFVEVLRAHCCLYSLEPHSLSHLIAHTSEIHGYALVFQLLYDVQQLVKGGGVDQVHRLSIKKDMPRRRMARGNRSLHPMPDMRAPSAASAVFALESAMDELAVALKLDPLELRLRCYSERDQHEDRPYRSKALRDCYREGAAAFGWDRRNPAPRSTRDGSDLVGWGMATGVWEALQVPITVRIVLTANGHAEVACATSDIGTGTYTIMAQVAADMLGLPLDNISVKLGDSSLPQSPVEGGSWIAASVSNGIVTTADAIRGELLRLARQMPNSPLANAAPEEVAFSEGKLVSKRDASRAVSIADAMRHGNVDRIEQEKATNPAHDVTHASNTHAAIFAEVQVDEQLGVIRVTRVVSAVAAGRILNTKTASSQILGGVVWGIGMALHEETLIDHRFGRIMNANIAEYHVPVNADVHDIKVILVDEQDDSNPLGVKGIGEIGIVGVAAAIANAVYHATGKRIRDLPITLDKLR